MPFCTSVPLTSIKTINAIGIANLVVLALVMVVSSITVVPIVGWVSCTVSNLFRLVFFLLPSWAMADDLRVTLNLGVGRDQVIYNLSTADSREFLSRWSRLPKTEAMLPLNGNL